MTIVNGIEIDHINVQRNFMKDAISNNYPIEDKLNVIIVISNPCEYARRFILAKEFMARIEMEEINVRLFVVELCYSNQKFRVTNMNNPNHLQLRTNTEPIWHKESMINVAVEKLLPKNWRAMAWIDADVSFENHSWALDTLKILNGASDIVQLWSHCCDLDKNEMTMNMFNSFCYQYTKGKKYCGSGINYWHPGFAWACTRKAYEKMGGIYDLGILGSSDNIMALAFIQNGLKGVNDESTDGYKKTISTFQENVKGLRLGYTPGVIRHYFHGSKANRKYKERWQILVSHKYDPITFIKKNNDNLLIPSNICPKELLDDIEQYFKERNEDEGFN